MREAAAIWEGRGALSPGAVWLRRCPAGSSWRPSPATTRRPRPPSSASRSSRRLAGSAELSGSSAAWLPR
eukprot:1344128-Alexandrium_andersonii.AAC.3